MRKTDPLHIGCAPGWSRHPDNPIMGDDYGETYDLSIVHLDDGRKRMYLSIRNNRSIGYTESDDGVHWTPVQKILSPRPELVWEEDINRPMVILQDGKFYMWYTALHYVPSEENVFDVQGVIAYAVSEDGFHFERLDEPVLHPDAMWENGHLQCPHVLYDEERKVYRMWFSGGGHWEADRIGYAESLDGIHWIKSELNPIFEPIRENYWERAHTEAAQVIPYKGWYYMFYLGMEDMYKGTINAARSKDGITGWERYPSNPLLYGGMPGAWDIEAIYKPWIEKVENGWWMYTNPRRAGVEMIGIYPYEHDELFPDWPIV